MEKLPLSDFNADMLEVIDVILESKDDEKDDILEIYTFSFGDPSAVVEKIVKITSNYAIDTKLINHDNRWKVNITYRMLENKKIIATYTGDINTIAELTKATLKLNHVE